MILIGYDLKKPGRNYQELYSAIQSLGEWWHYLDSTWLIHTNFQPSQIREHLTQYIDSNDRLLVIEVEPSTAAGWLTQDAFDWISARARSYR